MRYFRATLSYQRLLQRHPDLYVEQLKVFFADSFALLGPVQALCDYAAEHVFMVPDERISFFQLAVRRKGQEEHFYFALRNSIPTLSLVDIAFEEIDVAPVCAQFCRAPALPGGVYLGVRENGVTMCHRCDCALGLHLHAASVGFSLVYLNEDLSIVQSAVVYEVSGLQGVTSNGAVYRLQLALPEAGIGGAGQENGADDEPSSETQAARANNQAKELKTYDLIFTVFPNERVPGVQAQLAKCEASFSSYAVLQLSQALEDGLLVLGARPFALEEVFNQPNAKCALYIFTNANQERLVRVYSDAVGSAQNEEFLRDGVTYYVRTLSAASEFTVSQELIYGALARMRPLVRIAPGWRLWISDNYYAKQERIRNDLVKAATCRAEMKAHAQFAKALAERAGAVHGNQTVGVFAAFKTHAAARILAIKKHYLQVQSVEDSIYASKMQARELEGGNARLAKRIAALQAQMNDTERQRIEQLRARQFVPRARPEEEISIMDPQRQKLADLQHERQFQCMRDDAQRRSAFNEHLREQQREQLEERLRSMRSTAHAGTEQLEAQRKQVQEQYEAALRKRSEKSKQGQKAAPASSASPPGLGLKASLMGRK